MDDQELHLVLVPLGHPHLWLMHALFSPQSDSGASRAEIGGWLVQEPAVGLVVTRRVETGVKSDAEQFVELLLRQSTVVGL